MLFAVADKLPFLQFLEFQTPSTNPVMVETSKSIKQQYVQHSAEHHHIKGAEGRTSVEN
jgi:hypothetical protein